MAPADTSTVRSASTAPTERRQGVGDDGGPTRLVADTGTSRSMPGASQTTHTRPRCCLFVSPKQGRVKPYSGCVGSVTSICSVGGTLMPTGAVSCVGAQPGGERLGRPVRQHVHWAMA